MTYDVSGQKSSRRAPDVRPGRPNPAAAALLSSFVAGAGQMYLGEMRDGLVWLVVVKTCYSAGLLILFLAEPHPAARILLLLGVFLHVVCIIHAAVVARNRRSVAPKT
jgi:hypothetical protein